MLANPGDLQSDESALTSLRDGNAAFRVRFSGLQSRVGIRKKHRPLASCTVSLPSSGSEPGMLS